MSNTINVSDYGLALITLSVANQLSLDIKNVLCKYEYCILDFSNVLSLTTQVANAIFSPLILLYGIDNIRKKIKFVFTNDDILYTVSEALNVH